MKTKAKTNIKYLGLVFSIVLLINFVKELAYFTLHSLDNFSHSIYALFWILVVLVLIVIFINKIEGIKISEFLFYSILLGFVFSIFSLIINHTLGTDKIIHKKYSGVYSSVEGHDNQTETNEDINIKTYVINNRNKSLLHRELRKLKTKYGEAFEDKFYFWQTAFAYGFQPKYISGYSGKNTFSKKTTLFFSVGIFFIIEAFINALFSTITIMIIPLVGLLFKERLFNEKLSKLKYNKNIETKNLFR